MMTESPAVVLRTQVRNFTNRTRYMVRIIIWIRSSLTSAIYWQLCDFITKGAVQQEIQSNSSRAPSQGALAGNCLQDSVSSPCLLRPTFLRVVEDLHFVFLWPYQGLCQLGQGTLHGARAHQELACTGLLQDLRPGETKQLAEAFVAVDDATVLHLSVGDQKLAIWKGKVTNKAVNMTINKLL